MQMIVVKLKILLHFLFFDDPASSFAPAWFQFCFAIAICTSQPCRNERLATWTCGYFASLARWQNWAVCVVYCPPEAFVRHQKKFKSKKYSLREIASIFGKYGLIELPSKPIVYPFISREETRNVMMTTVFTCSQCVLLSIHNQSGCGTQCKKSVLL